MSKELRQFKKYLLKGWGKPCKDFSAMCSCCLVWRAFETIESWERLELHFNEGKKK